MQRANSRLSLSGHHQRHDRSRSGELGVLEEGASSVGTDGATTFSMRRFMSKWATQARTSRGIFTGATTALGDITREVMEARDVSVYYHKTGWAQAIARSDRFINFTLFVISTNTVWIGIEEDTNDSPDLFSSAIGFQIVELIFYSFFILEWLIRFAAFKKKRDCCRDMWFVFDSLLVCIMTLDTLVFPLALSSSSHRRLASPSPSSGSATKAPSSHSSSSTSSSLSLLRIARLLKLTRMLRFLRAVPELVTLFKAIRIAAKPVFWTLVLVVVIVYVFSLIFRTELPHPQHPYLEPRLSSLPMIMWCLLLQGGFHDRVVLLMQALLEESYPLAVLLIILVLVTNVILVEGLLVGLVIETMIELAHHEHEKAAVNLMKNKLQGVLEALDEDGSGTISQQEFDKMMVLPHVVATLDALGIDVPNLMSLSDHIFEPEANTYASSRPTLRDKAAVESEHALDALEDQDAQPKISVMAFHPADEGVNEEAAQEEDVEEDEYAMTFLEFINTCVRLRSDNPASVTDLMDLRRLMMQMHNQTEFHMKAIEATNTRLHQDMETKVNGHPLMQMIRAHPSFRSHRSQERRTCELKEMSNSPAQSLDATPGRTPPALPPSPPPPASHGSSPTATFFRPSPGQENSPRPAYPEKTGSRAMAVGDIGALDGEVWDQESKYFAELLRSDAPSRGGSIRRSSSIPSLSPDEIKQCVQGIRSELNAVDLDEGMPLSPVYRNLDGEDVAGQLPQGRGKDTGRSWACHPKILDCCEDSGTQVEVYRGPPLRGLLLPEHPSVTVVRQLPAEQRPPP